MSTLRLILGDQLNASHSWFRETDPEVHYLIAELPQEASYVRHHVQKICAFFAAMQQFAQALRAAGHQVIHLTLDETAEYRDLPDLLRDKIVELGVERFEYQRPDEWRLLQQLRDFDPQCAMREVDTEHFLLPFDEIFKQFKPGRASRMEAFYRRMRKRYGYLMDGEEPVGERWNFDSENRQKLKPSDLEAVPAPLLFSTDVTEILARLERHKVDHFGEVHPQLLWPTRRSEALELLDYFCTHQLALFGRFQDAMTSASEHKWSLYHSRLSFAINAKMISPRQVIEAAIAAWQSNPKQIGLAQIEGFVRQILGWREFIRAIYWINQPEYSSLNALDAHQPLPDYFWSGKTKMHCMQQCISQSLDYAYAHHIQRLMVTGNFALIAQLHPDQVDAWYLGVYIDAIEWVEQPNTRGMVLFADNGIVASKPYAGSGAYINRMSDYCKGCSYKVNEQTGSRACPFNSLYWGFMLKHRDRLANNPRIAMLYKNWDKREPDAQQAILDRANWCLENLNEL
ncbi:MAG: cryptochrome/photolyase family protein [Oceanospirillaceae bacterium]|nr:cryptochrome/photolyase family protein [Oceanospirillaceae bacterium]